MFVEGITAFLLLGLFGSAHCLGMCGGFSLIAGRQGRWLPYAAGKTISYGVLGAGAGLLGNLIVAMASVQVFLSISVGVILIIMGAALAGLIPDNVRLSNPLTSRLGPVLGRVMGSGKVAGGLAMGLLNGLLPCGLVYAALVKSVEPADWLTGAGHMAVFGIGTLPGLWLISSLGSRITPKQRLWIVRAGGWLVIALGIFTIWRATLAGGTPMHH